MNFRRIFDDLRLSLKIEKLKLRCILAFKRQPGLLTTPNYILRRAINDFESNIPAGEELQTLDKLHTSIYLGLVTINNDRIVPGARVLPWDCDISDFSGETLEIEGIHRWSALYRDFSVNSFNGSPIGDIDCIYNARSSHLRCAVNPDGPCEGCPQQKSF